MKKCCCKHERSALPHSASLQRQLALGGGLGWAAFGLCVLLGAHALFTASFLGWQAFLPAGEPAELAAHSGVVRLPGDRLLVLTGTRVFGSDDGGASWQQVALLPAMRWPTLFACASGVYALGMSHEALVISSMLDSGGARWAAAVAVSPPHLQVCKLGAGVDVSAGRVTVVFQLRHSTSPGTEAHQRCQGSQVLLAMGASAVEQLDLCNSKSWTFSNGVGDPTSAHAGAMTALLGLHENALDNTACVSGSPLDNHWLPSSLVRLIDRHGGKPCIHAFTACSAVGGAALAMRMKKKPCWVGDAGTGKLLALMHLDDAFLSSTGALLELDEVGGTLRFLRYAFLPSLSNPVIQYQNETDLYWLAGFVRANAAPCSTSHSGQPTCKSKCLPVGSPPPAAVPPG